MKFSRACSISSLKIIAPLTFALAGVGIESGPAQALSFNFAPQFDVTSAEGSNVFAGFQEAGAIWSTLFSDDVVVNLDVDFAPLGENILGGARNTSSILDYTTVKQALKADATSTRDRIASNNLLEGPDLSLLITEASTGATRLDNNNTNNNVFLNVNNATAKALGLGQAITSTAPDANITFASGFYDTFDFDRSNGIGRNQFDFVGIALHEIGHVLGFTSGVDTIDFFSEPNGPGADFLPSIGATFDDFAIVQISDLFRYSEDSLAVDSLDLVPGNEAFFSIDGGKTSLGQLSTGEFNGDGAQASHWKPSEPGIMVPFAPRGTVFDITRQDAHFFDAIGWDATPAAVPEPSSLMGLAAFGIAVLSRRKRADSRG